MNIATKSTKRGVKKYKATAPANIREWGARVFLLFAGIVLAFVILEVAVRLRTHHILSWVNAVAVFNESQHWKHLHATHFDAELGWIPEPDHLAKDEISGLNVQTIANGIRTNGKEAKIASKTILAVGDSFTFGDEVSDTETWPAALERLTPYRVINGGVFGYGLDQIVLRSEKLLEKYPADLLIVSFIVGDLERCQLSVYHRAPKPYFVIDRGHLALLGPPLPDWTEDRKKIPVAQRYLGYSVLIDRLMSRANPEFWYGGGSTYVHRQGPEVGCLLMKRLAENVVNRRSVPVLVLAQPIGELSEKYERIVGSVMECARVEGLQTLDLHPLIRKIYTKHPQEFQSLFKLHMTPKGNMLVAQEINHYIQQTALLKR